MTEELVNRGLKGALGGLLAAILVDLHAWSRSKEPFDWSLAARRWIAGAIAGCAAALGVA